MSPTDSTLPASRRPVPLAPEVREEMTRQPRSADQIERDLAERTDRLSANIDELVSRLAPSQLAGTAWAGARSRLVTSDGKPKLEVVGAALGALVGVAFLVWRARR